MGKGYLNRREKDDVLVLASFKNYMDRLSEKLEELNKSKEMIKYAKMSRSFAYKVLVMQLEGLRKEDQDNIRNESKKLRVAIHYNKDAINEFEKMKKADGITPVETEDFLDVVAVSISVCRTCSKVGKEADECYLRKIYFKYDIEPINYDAQEGQCQYQY